MSKKSVLDAMRVSRPCSEDWDQMTGNDRVRFCSHCAKDVNNISEIAPKEAVRLVRASGGNICIRYKFDPVTKAPIFAERFHQIARRAPALASGAMAASIALSSAAFAQGEGESTPPPAFVRLNKSLELPARNSEMQDRTPLGTGTVSGRVMDPNGAVITHISVAIVNEASGESRTIEADDDGFYEFSNLPEGAYTIKTDYFRSFSSKTIRNVVIATERPATVDMTLDISVNVSSGGMEVMSVEYKGSLATAVGTEDIDEVKELIAKGENVNQREEDKTTPLFVAVENGNLEITQTLLDFGAKVNARNKEKQTPLMQLDEDATEELVSLLLRYGAKVNLVDNDGNTALILAARQVSTGVLKALIDAGADVNLTNNDGRSALMNAANKEDLESVRSLLLAGAKVNQRDKDGESAWDLTSNDEIEDLLISFGTETGTPVESPISEESANDQ